MNVSFPHNFASARDVPDLADQVSEFAAKLQDYLDNQVNIFLVTDPKARQPSFDIGDIVFDFTKKPGFVTLLQWDGENLIPLNFATIAGFVNLITQGTGSGNDPSLFLRSDGDDGWVLASPPLGPTGPTGATGATGASGATGPTGPANEGEPLSNGEMSNPEILFDSVTGDVVMSG